MSEQTQQEIPTRLLDLKTYKEGGWRTAIDGDLYECLGFSPQDVLSKAQVEEAFKVRLERWKAWEKQYITTPSDSIREIGPRVAQAKRNLELACRTLCDKALRADYDRKRAQDKMTAWQRSELVAVVDRLTPPITEDKIAGLLASANAKGILPGQARQAIEAELFKKGLSLTRSPKASLPSWLDARSLLSPDRLRRSVAGRLAAIMPERAVQSDPAIHALLDRKRQERQQREAARRRSRELERLLKPYVRQENERIQALAANFNRRWVRQTEWTDPSRIAVGRAPDGGVILQIRRADVHIACHQDQDQWWYWIRNRVTQPTTSPWVEWDVDYADFDQLKAAFLSLMDQFLDVERI